MSGPGAHRSFRIEVERENAFAVCSCGWRSGPAMNAGMAGALWDKHREEAMVDDAGAQAFPRTTP